MINIQFKVYKQLSIEDCGPTCLYMILRYYGAYEKLDTIKKLCETDIEGTSLYNLKQAALKLGFNAEAFHAKTFNLKENVHLPFIAHVLIDEKYYHYVVVVKIKTNIFYIADPKNGKLLKMNFNEFNKIFLESILMLYPVKIFKRKPEKNIKIILKILNSVKDKIIKITIYSLLNFILEILFLYSFYLFLSISKKQNIHLLHNFIIFMFFTYTLKNLANYICKRKIIIFTSTIYIKLKEKFYNWIYALPYHEVKKKNSMECLLKLESLEKILDYFLELILFIFFELLPFIVIMIWFTLSKNIFLYICIYIIINLLIAIILGNKKRNLFISLKEDKSSNKRYEIESLSSVDKISSLSLGNTMVNRMLKQGKYINENKNTKNIKYLKLDSILTYINDITYLILEAILFILLINSIYSLEQLIFMIYLIEKINEFINSFASIYINSSEIRWALENIDLNIKCEKIRNTKKVELKNISYPYYGNIKNVSLNLEAKKPILIIGKSGIGKSTLGHIITGEEKVNNRYINDIETKDKVNSCYIDGDGIIYTTTILENILLGRNILEEDLQDILTLTHVDKIIAKNKYIPLLEKGENLSSGEKQKICLARALINNVDILVFDEALNRLDQREEKEIMENILKKYNDKIIVVISHRYNLITLFKNIYTITPHGNLKKLKGRELTCLEKY